MPKTAVTPLGRTEFVRVTPPVNPSASTTVIVSVPLPPWATVRDEAEEVRVKLGEGDPPSGNWMLSSRDSFKELGGVLS